VILEIIAGTIGKQLRFVSVFMSALVSFEERHINRSNAGFGHGLGFALSLMFPVPRDSIRRTRQPLWIIPKFRQVHGGKVFHPVPRSCA